MKSKNYRYCDTALLTCPRWNEELNKFIPGIVHIILTGEFEKIHPSIITKEIMNTEVEKINCYRLLVNRKETELIPKKLLTLEVLEKSFQEIDNGMVKFDGSLLEKIIEVGELEKLGEKGRDFIGYELMTKIVQRKLLRVVNKVYPKKFSAAKLLGFKNSNQQCLLELALQRWDGEKIEEDILTIQNIFTGQQCKSLLKPLKELKKNLTEKAKNNNLPSLPGVTTEEIRINFLKDLIKKGLIYQRVKKEKSFVF